MATTEPAACADVAVMSDELLNLPFALRLVSRESPGAPHEIE